jgi:hypothetical protein
MPLNRELELLRNVAGRQTNALEPVLIKRGSHIDPFMTEHG